jgi:hypothetical protein
MRPSLLRATRIVCFTAAAIGMGVSAYYAIYLAPIACCDASFLYLTGRLLLDYGLAPLLAGLSLSAAGLAGRLLFWSSCAWMVLMVWPPMLVPLAGCCIWTRLRLGEAAAAPAPRVDGDAAGR